MRVTVCLKLHLTSLFLITRVIASKMGPREAGLNRLIFSVTH